jgi:hypothetical protein
MPSVEILLQKRFGTGALVYKEAARRIHLKELSAGIVASGMQSLDDIRFVWQGAHRGHSVILWAPIFWM